MSADEDFEAYRREQLTQVRDIRVTDEGLQSFEKGLVRIIVRSEGSSQELKVNELELDALAGAAGAHLAKKIPETLQAEFEAAPWEQLPDLPKLKAAIREAELKTEQTALHGDTGDIVDAAVEEGNAWHAYAEGLEQFLAAAGRRVRAADGPGAVPVPLHTLTYAATALEGSADNGDRYAARQIREAIAQHPSPEAYAATKPESHAHKPVQHRDGKPPWCHACGLTADGQMPVSRFHRDEESSRYVTIRDSAGVPVYDIETTPEEPEAAPTGRPLDPKPWFCTSCSDRFARQQVAPTTHVTVFDPRPQYEQEKGYYA